jgi:ankyrin repeat protein
MAEAAVQAIHRAVDHGDTATVAKMLDADPGLLTTVKGKRSLLTRAALAGHFGMVTLLLERGTDVNTSDPWGDFALYLAAQRGWEEVVSTLLRSGADVYRPAPFGDTSLIVASARGHVAVVRLLLRSMGAYGLNDRDGCGCTALYWACFHGRVDMVRTLLLAGADHTIVVHGVTLRQLAQNRGQTECATLVQVSRSSATAAQTKAAGRIVSIGRTMHFGHLV